ncbi:acyltransferase domain-containing protein [Gordonia sp. TBRC 11910]|uniref:Acyltransferase domain-containing protein n=1 Tax=Gordonia asplenii TaxID=2725283 RepID=A0A848L0D6_9ACTN|nr:acyltransferase domain-containing protein [Gordonia asplenii]NMO04149.1 acyltransferase domain-containing protein [Gordonia asplenii]
MNDLVLPDGLVATLISSESQRGLATEAGAVADYLDAHRDVEPLDVSRMLMRTREIRRFRALIRATGRDDAIAALRAVAAGTPHPNATVSSRPATSRRVALVFPGQGSQRAGMGRGHYERCPEYRRRVDEVNAEFIAEAGIAPLDYLLDDEHVEDVKIVQPAIFLHTLGLARMWRAAGVEPVATVGHSQGEIAAVVESGHMSLRDGIRVVTVRAQEIEKLENSGDYPPCAMAVFALRRDQLEDRLARLTGWAELAVVNSSTIHALSGYEDVIDALVAEYREAGVFAQRIGVDHAGHSARLRRHGKVFSGAHAGLEASSFADGDLMCFGATLGEPITPELPISDYWSWNLRNTVRFDSAIATAAAHGIDTFIEMSEHPTMLLSIGETLAENGVRAAVVGTGNKNADAAAEFTRNLSTVIVDDTQFRWPTIESGSVPIDFPNTEFDEALYWAPVSAPQPVAAR